MIKAVDLSERLRRRMLASSEKGAWRQADRSVYIGMRQRRTGRAKPDDMNLRPARLAVCPLDPSLRQPAPGPGEPPGAVAGAVAEGADPVCCLVRVAGSTFALGGVGRVIN